MTDIMEDLLAIRYAMMRRIESGGTGDCCPVCGSDLEEGDDGEMHCPECDG